MDGWPILLRRRLHALFGLAPHFVRSAAAADLWAYYTVLGLTTFPPVGAADCQEILNTMKRGFGKAVSHKSVLTRIWCRIAEILDSDTAAERDFHLLYWMPSHSTRAKLGINTKLSGSGLHSLAPPLDWRANRLADLAAKSALIGYSMDKVSKFHLRSRKDISKKALTQLAKVVLPSELML